MFVSKPPDDAVSVDESEDVDEHEEEEEDDDDGGLSPPLPKWFVLVVGSEWRRWRRWYEEASSVLTDDMVVSLVFSKEVGVSS